MALEQWASANCGVGQGRELRSCCSLFVPLMLGRAVITLGTAPILVNSIMTTTEY